MTYYEDLSDYVYHKSEFYRYGTRNVGWLGLGHDFKKAEPSEEILSRLWAYCGISVAQSRGVHDCEFCSEGDSYRAERNGEELLLGTSEIRVFSKSGDIYAAPTLICHYVKVHHYAPPDRFVKALTQGPAPPSREYLERLEELGLEWRRTSAPSGPPFRIGRPDSKA